MDAEGCVGENNIKMVRALLDDGEIHNLISVWHQPKFV